MAMNLPNTPRQEYNLGTNLFDKSYKIVYFIALFQKEQMPKKGPDTPLGDDKKTVKTAAVQTTQQTNGARLTQPFSPALTRRSERPKNPRPSTPSAVAFTVEAQAELESRGGSVVEIMQAARDLEAADTGVLEIDEVRNELELLGLGTGQAPIPSVSQSIKLLGARRTAQDTAECGTPEEIDFFLEEVRNEGRVTELEVDIERAAVERRNAIAAARLELLWDGESSDSETNTLESKAPARRASMSIEVPADIDELLENEGFANHSGETLGELGLKAVTIRIKGPVSKEKIGELKRATPKAALVSTSPMIGKVDAIITFLIRDEDAQAFAENAISNESVVAVGIGGSQSTVHGTPTGIILNGVDSSQIYSFLMKFNGEGEKIHTTNNPPSLQKREGSRPNLEGLKKPQIPEMSSKKSFLFTVTLPETETGEIKTKHIINIAKLAEKNSGCYVETSGNTILVFTQNERPISIGGFIQSCQKYLDAQGVEAEMKFLQGNLKTTNLHHATLTTGEVFERLQKLQNSKPGEIEVDIDTINKFTTSRYWDLGLELGQRTNENGEVYWVIEKFGAKKDVMKRGYIGREHETATMQAWQKECKRMGVVGGIFGVAGCGKTEFLRQTMPKGAAYVRPTTEDGSGIPNEELVAIGNKTVEYAKKLGIESDQEYFNTLTPQTCKNSEFLEAYLDLLRKISEAASEQNKIFGLVPDDYDAYTPQAQITIVDLIDTIKDNPRYKNILLVPATRSGIKYSDDIHSAKKINNADAARVFVTQQNLANTLGQRQITIGPIQLGRENRGKPTYITNLDDFVIGHAIEALGLKIDEDLLTKIRLKNPTLVGKILAKTARKQPESTPVLRELIREYGDESLHRMIEYQGQHEDGESQYQYSEYFWDQFIADHGPDKFMELVRYVMNERVSRTNAKNNDAYLSLPDIEEDLGIDMQPYEEAFGINNFDLDKGRGILQWQSNPAQLRRLAKRKYKDGEIAAVPYYPVHVIHELSRLGYLQYDSETNELSLTEYDEAMNADIATEPEDIQAKQFDRLSQSEQKSILYYSLIEGLPAEVAAIIPKLFKKPVKMNWKSEDTEEHPTSVLKGLSILQSEREIFESGDKIKMVPQWKEFTERHFIENPELAAEILQHIVEALIIIESEEGDNQIKISPLIIFNSIRRLEEMQRKNGKGEIAQRTEKLIPLYSMEAACKAIESENFDDAYSAAMIFLEANKNETGPAVDMNKFEAGLIVIRAATYKGDFETAKRHLKIAMAHAEKSKTKYGKVAEIGLQLYDLQHRQAVNQKRRAPEELSEFIDYLELVEPTLLEKKYSSAVAKFYRAKAIKDGLATNNVGALKLAAEEPQKIVIDQNPELTNAEVFEKALLQTAARELNLTSEQAGKLKKGQALKLMFEKALNLAAEVSKTLEEIGVERQGKLSQQLFVSNAYLRSAILIDIHKGIYSHDFGNIMIAHQNGEGTLEADLSTAENCADISLEQAAEFKITDTETLARASLIKALAIGLGNQAPQSIIAAVQTATIFSCDNHPTLRNVNLIQLSILALDVLKRSTQLTETDSQRISAYYFDTCEFIYNQNQEDFYAAFNYGESTVLKCAKMAKTAAKPELIVALKRSLQTLETTKEQCLEAAPTEFITQIAQHAAIAHAAGEDVLRMFAAGYTEILDINTVQKNKPQEPKQDASTTAKIIYNGKEGVTIEEATDIRNVVQIGLNPLFKHLEKVMAEAA